MLASKWLNETKYVVGKIQRHHAFFSLALRTTDRAAEGGSALPFYGVVDNE